MLLPVIVALELMFPATSSLYCGLDVPMPTLPLESRRMRSPQALPLKVQNARLLAGPLEPLMISPVWEELSYPRWMPLLFVGSINAPRLYQFPIIEAPGLLSVKGFVGLVVPMPRLPFLSIVIRTGGSGTLLAAAVANIMLDSPETYELRTILAVDLFGSSTAHTLPL